MSENTVASDEKGEHNKDDPQEFDPLSIADDLVNLDTRQIAEIVAETLGQLGEDKAQEVFKEFEKIGQGVPVDE